MNRLVKVALFAVVAVVILIAVAMHLWLGTVIKAGIERVGPEVTGTSVTLKDVDIGLIAGRAQLEGLTVGNPKGFAAPAALKIGTARVRVNWGSVLSDRVVIEEITIDGPEVTYEGLLSKSNFSTLLKNVQLFSSTRANPKPTGPLAQPARSTERKFWIKELNVTNGHVALWVGSALLANQNLSMALPAIHLMDIGKNSGGATAEEVVAAVLAALNKASAEAVAEAAKPLERAAKTAEELAGQGATKALEGVKGFLK
jgi:hypothetical protein